MNILTDTLPETVEVDGLEYPVSTDFKTNLLTIMAFEDLNLTSQEKVSVLLSNTYTEDVPPNTQAAVDAAIRFLDCGDVKTGDGAQSDGKRYYLFSKDASLIYSAFRQTHGIDLQVTSMHWWKFVALFMDLGSDTLFSSLVSLRRRVKNGEASKEERKVAERMGGAFDIPDIDIRTVEEKLVEQEFLSILNRGAQ